MPTCVRTGEPECAELSMSVRQDLVAVRAGTDVVRRVAHVRRVAVVDDAGTLGVAGEDAVLAARIAHTVGVRRRRGEVVAPERAHPDLAGAVTTVPPDFVAFT